MVKKKLILVINPGSTSTKAACFQEKKLVNWGEWIDGVCHSQQDRRKSLYGVLHAGNSSPNVALEPP